ncbi:HEAT repeat domain-containing protein [Paludisphaera mucosa]|uniref:HEAT repeat domain-containing protein n=1 Tax=Paludisphaera mucosa TaxID=3030827 RepID=A0ABT6FK58_9BACT|nr:HEAT repeat domain-containing protein [Paludisphaera mucosa]MDG3007929.1 HEAT repeat domain-containing protein [Paludisphaera mucosa]
MSIRESIRAMIAMGGWAFASAALAGAVDDLKSEDVELRRSAAAAIRSGPRDARIAALPGLIDRLMTEKDGQVRLSVLDAVTSLGPDAAPAVDALVHTLRTNYGGQGREESHQDYRSALALAAIGKPAVEPLRGLLKERRESVRAEVVMAFGRIGPDAAAAVPDLSPLLADPSDRIRTEAVRSLGSIGPAAVDPLIAACSDENAKVRSGAVEALGYATAPDPRAVRAALDRARDAAPEVRAAALRALTKLKAAVPEADALAAFQESLRHADQAVQLAAVDGFVERPALLPKAADELEALLIAPGEGVARRAAFLIGRMGADAAPRLLRALADEHSPVEAIAEALAHLGRPVVPALTAAVDSPTPRVRRAAILALGSLRPLAPGAVEILSKGLRDPDPGVSAASLAALGNLGPRAAAALPEIRALLKADSADLRAKAVDVLAQAAPRDARLADDFLAAVDDPAPAVRRRALEHLRGLGTLGRRAIPPAIAKLSDPDDDVRAAAADFLGGHGPSAAEAVPALTTLLSSPTPRLQVLAAQTLGKLGRTAQPAFEAVAALLESPSVEAREAAAQTLGGLDLDAEAVRPRLARALRDESSVVRKAALRTVQRFGPAASYFAPDVILMAVEKEDRPAVERMIKRLERRGPDPRTIPELAARLGHDHPAVRLLAIKLLALAGPAASTALPSLERLREDPDAEVRTQAKAACDQIKPAKPPGQA